MTCIVGIEQDGYVYIGGDSAGVDVENLSICTRADEKVFVSDGGEFIMGFAGSFRIGQLLRYAFVAPDQSSKKDDMAYMVTDFVDAIRTMQRDKGALKKENEIEEHEAEFLVGYKGKLYIIDTDFQIGRPLENYMAIGCAAQVALGALYATRDSDMSPEERITLALNAATEYNVGVKAPFIVLRLGEEETE